MPTAVPLSVIMPTYNEQQAIVPAVAEVQRHVLDRVAGAELVVVNDGSRDRHRPPLDDTAATDSRVRVIHQENRGHGGALIAGLSAARGDYIFLVDSDRQIPLDEFSSGVGRGRGRPGSSVRRPPAPPRSANAVVSVGCHSTDGAA